jgi:hypothetical protein
MSYRAKYRAGSAENTNRLVREPCSTSQLLGVGCRATRGRGGSETSAAGGEGADGAMKIHSHRHFYGSGFQPAHRAHARIDGDSRSPEGPWT